MFHRYQDMDLIFFMQVTDLHKMINELDEGRQSNQLLYKNLLIVCHQVVMKK